MKEFARKASKSQDRAIKEEYEILTKVQKTLGEEKLEIRNVQWAAK